MSIFADGDEETRAFEHDLTAAENGPLDMADAGSLCLFALTSYDGTPTSAGRLVRARLLLAANYVATGDQDRLRRAGKLCVQTMFWGDAAPLGYETLAAYSNLDLALLLRELEADSQRRVYDLANSAAQRFELVGGDSLRHAALARLVAADASLDLPMAQGPQRWHHLRPHLDMLLGRPPLHALATWLINEGVGPRPEPGITLGEFVRYKTHLDN